MEVIKDIKLTKEEEEILEKASEILEDLEMLLDEEFWSKNHNVDYPIPCSETIYKIYNTIEEIAYTG